jgi:opacity protein-like surface antigen
MMVAFAGAVAGAEAQTAPPTPWYVAGVAGATFGSSSGGLFGGEAGYQFSPKFEVFVEVGWATNVTPKFLKDRVRVVDAYLRSEQVGTVGSSIKDPMSYGSAGLRYYIDLGGRFKPFVLGGVGVANVRPKARFRINGSDVTSRLGDYGVQLGRDLTSHLSKPMVAAGFGVMLPQGRLRYDLSYRYDWVLTDQKVTGVHRLYGGVGYRF